MATGMFDNDPSGLCLQQSPGVPNSPASIPLPDSLPPEDSEEVLEQGEKLGEDEEPPSYNNHETGGPPPINNVAPRTGRGSRKSGSSSRKPRLIEEYDPSEPLTSSDEEEHSIQLIEGETPTEFRISYTEVTTPPSETNNSSNNLVKVSKTPPPPPILSSSKQTPPFSISPPRSKQSPQVNIVPPNLEHVFTPTNVNYNNGSGNSNSIRIDLGSSTSSNASDDKRRPVIHFSIPTRHRLLPISTLIKRQKGNARREMPGQNFDPTRGSDKLLLDGEEDDEDGEETQKISLVAEIFGDDDDEEEDEVENKTDGAALPQTAKSQGKDTLNEEEEEGDPGLGQGELSVTDKSQLLEANSGRWKIVDNELSLPPVVITPENNSFPQSSETISEKDVDDPELNNELPKATSSLQGGKPGADGESGLPSQEDEPEIIEIVTINVPSSNRLRPLRRRPFLSRYGMENGGEPEVIDIDKDDDDEVPVEPPKRIEEPAPPSPPVIVEEPVIDPIPEPAIATPPTTPPPPANIQVIVEPPPEVRPERHRVVSGSEPEQRHRRSYSRSAERERPHFKRPHSSSSVSNCEEGEIVDQVNPNKRRKKDKKRKMKKRKKSRDSMTPPPKSSSEKKSSEVGTSAASDKEENSSRSAISWRKPSKRTQNRNYRDGKPKADDNLFREREAEERQRRSNSPSHKRNRGSTRKEKSPIGNKSSSKHKRDAPETLNRTSSKSPSRVASESRSKGGGGVGVGSYLGRRRHRRSRSNSSSSGRSISRRRSSRRRYRRSTSRHHPGDSRSPSYITELIRSRSSNLTKLSDRSRSRSRDRHGRGRHRKSSLSRSRSHSPVIGGHRKNRKAESSSDRQHKKKQLKEKEKQLIEETNAENKEKRKERERLKEREKEKRTKKKEKTQEENKKEQKEKEKVKEKEKKKKRKRREKSPTPVKAIVADGDSIVVSLSFSKGKTATTTSNAQSRASTEDHSKDHHHNGLAAAETTEASNNQQHPHVNGNDGTERNPTIDEDDHHHHHHHHEPQSSPSKSADENDSATPNDPAQASESSKGKKADEKETETIKVTSSGGGSCGSRSPFETENSCSAVADSTKVIQVEQYESSFSHSRRSPSMSPTDVESNLQGDSLVTSTGDTIDLPTSVEEEAASKLNSSSTPSKPTDSSKLFSGMAHKPTANMSPRGAQATTTSCTTAESSSTPSATTSHASTSAGGGSQNFASTSTPHSRPLIGNIPGLYPSSAINSSGGAAPVPPPIVIPTPPPPQGIRFSGGNPNTPMLNPNVLASVASALLAVRQNQPAGSGKMAHASAGSGSISDSSNMQLRHMNVLGPKSQNFTIQSSMRNSSGGNNYTEEQGGDSPMSPNSSEGDDLFEPPTDRSQSGQGVNAGNNKGGKNVQQLFGNPNMLPTNNPIDSFNSAGHTNKERNIFDTLFESGPDIKKSTAAKPEKMTKTKQQKLRKAAAGGGGPKKETIKVNTSGGLTKGELRLADEVPTSAVELIVKQKYLKKLNRQERVVEEVKLSLKPHYSKRHINKDEYKEILRRAVPKICHNKTGEINPGKIKELVEAYVKKFRHARKRGLDMSSIK